LESVDAADVPAAGAQIGQTQQLLLGQWAIWLLQCLTDGGVQSGIRDSYFLCQSHGREASSVRTSGRMTGMIAFML
jgi:hypothetical protein